MKVFNVFVFVRFLVLDNHAGSRQSLLFFLLTYLFQLLTLLGNSFSAAVAVANEATLVSKSKLDTVSFVYILYINIPSSSEGTVTYISIYDVALVP